MPRSFLLKNYYPRNDIEDIQAAAANLLDLASSAPAPKERSVSDVFQCTDLLKWNYEYEKSYWFDTGALSGLQTQTDGQLSRDGCSSSGNSHCSDSSPKDFVVPRENETFSIKNFMHTTIKPVSDDTDKESETDTQQINNKNKENGDQLSLLFEKTLENTERTIRQFFENNRMSVENISDETGLDRLDLQNFIDGVSDLPSDEKMELYRWYLTKTQKKTVDEGSSDESYACHKCGKIFTYKSYLERHIKYVCPDSTGRTWKCSYCGKAFQYPCYLRRHVRSHTGESPYKCDKCDRAFVRSTDLQRHIRNHTGEKPYQCSQCSRAFARSTDLKRHMRTHTGEKPYKCWQCGKSFSQSGSLQTHIHTHAKDNLFTKTKKKP